MTLLKFQTQMFLLRLFDIILASIFFTILFPVFLIIVILILFDDLPIFYISKRVGKEGKIFNMYKFRSMREVKNKKIKDSDRLNKLGIFLRRSSLDEIPQLINVVFGQMSLVGPRALPLEIEKFLIKIKSLEGRFVLALQDYLKLIIWVKKEL